jgi:hypothetical protein
MSRGNTIAGAGGLLGWNTLWVALAFIAGIAGVALSFACWSQSSAPTGLWATALLLAAPVLAVVGTPVEQPGDGTPAELGDKFDRLDRSALALKCVQGARAVMFVGTSFTLVLWLCESGGITNSRQFVLPYTVICLGSLSLLPWLAARERQALKALALDCKALKEVKAGREWMDGGDERNAAKQVL